MRAGVAGEELRERVGHVGGEHVGQPARRHGAERVAVEAGVVGGDPALLAADPQVDRAALGGQRVEHRIGIDARQHAVGDLVAREVAEAAQDVGERVARLGAGAVGAVLEVRLDLVERAGVDELAQLLLAEQLAQEVAVERQRGGTPLGVRRVALVHVRRDVVEEQRRGERGRRRRLDLDERQLARMQRDEQLVQAGDVEDVAQALAVGLEDDREVGIAARDLQQ